MGNFKISTSTPLDSNVLTNAPTSANETFYFARTATSVHKIPNTDLKSRSGCYCIDATCHFPIFSPIFSIYSLMYKDVCLPLYMHIVIYTIYHIHYLDTYIIYITP